MRNFVKHIPSCKTCIYFIKNKNPLLSQCKLFDDQDGKKALVIYCRLDESLCGIRGFFYK